MFHTNGRCAKGKCTLGKLLVIFYVLSHLYSKESFILNGTNFFLIEALIKGATEILTKIFEEILTHLYEVSHKRKSCVNNSRS